MRSIVALRCALRRSMHRRPKHGSRLSVIHAVASFFLFATVFLLARPPFLPTPGSISVVLHSAHPVAPLEAAPGRDPDVALPSVSRPSAGLPVANAPLRSRVDAIVGEGAGAREALSDAYGIPQPVVANLTQLAASRLYWKLVYVDVVAALRIPHESAPPRLRPTARVLFVHTQNGLGNRLRALASGLALARATGRVPVVVWERDAHLGASFQELFRTDAFGSDISTVLYKDLIVLDTFPRWPLISDRTPHWHPVNYMTKDEPDQSNRLMRFALPLKNDAAVEPAFAANFLGVAAGTPVQQAVGLKQPRLAPHSQPRRASGEYIDVGSHLYIKSAYVVETKPARLSYSHVVNKELKGLQPSQAVQEIVDTMDQVAISKSIGIHIRSRMLAHDNVALDTNCEYTSSGAETTDFWRSRSQLPIFLSRMKSISKRVLERDTKFFVAADDVKVVQALQAEFPGRILSIPRNCDDRRRSCVLYAMADLLSLSRTSKIYGSNWSSFTEAAGRLGSKRVYLSGVNFGKKRSLRRLRLTAQSVWHHVRKLFSFVHFSEDDELFNNCRDRQ